MTFTQNYLHPLELGIFKFTSTRIQFCKIISILFKTKNQTVDSVVSKVPEVLILIYSQD